MSSTTTSLDTASQWGEHLTDLIHQDPVIQAHGWYFTCSYLLDFAEVTALLRLHRGRVDQLVLDPPPLESYDFAIRGPAELWRKFCQPVPPAMYHGIWSATFRSG
ncbi:MAG TPA: hypothetical protein VE152_03180, partial [Acidimicrobiales bacterium]|nr:hypothetical protein [Acidimicrobiales bacterium]